MFKYIAMFKEQLGLTFSKMHLIIFKLQFSPVWTSFLLASFFLLADYSLVKLISETFFNLLFANQTVKFLSNNNALLNK